MNTRKIALVEKFDPSIHITIKTDWMPVLDMKIPKSKSSRAITDKHGKIAVYQIAHVDDIKVIADNLVSDAIGYTGKSENIFGRMYALKMHKHTASPYIRTAFDLNKLRVRILFIDASENLDVVEKSIHDATEKAFGYRFAWKQASGGIDGNMMKIQDLIDRVDSEDSLRELADYIEEKAMEMYRQNWRSKED
jgi:hypothetical protein